MVEYTDEEIIALLLLQIGAPTITDMGGRLLTRKEWLYANEYLQRLDDALAALVPGSIRTNQVRRKFLQHVNIDLDGGRMGVY